MSDTNSAVTNLDDALAELSDKVNNVENVYIAPPLGETYSVWVKARRVNVNAVNSHSNGIVQDYALVISSGNTVSTNSQITVADPVYTNNAAPIVVAMQPAGSTNNGIALFNQRVGANSPYITTTNGATNQWAFYTFRNVTSFTNVAILTFLPPNVGFLRPDPNLTPRTPRFNEGDIDLYVARSIGPLATSYFNLTNLDDSVIAGSDRSTRRGGTEFVVYSNSANNEVFYIGVKAEDQQAATFGLFAVASEKPFSSRNDSNNIVAQAIGIPGPIPDGSADAPGGTNFIMLVMEEASVQRIYVTNQITHENPGDLMGILNHTDQTTGEAFATLNSHRHWPGNTARFIYDDSGQGDIDDAHPSDGPGTLNDFVGHQALGPWFFSISDNAFGHTGTVDELTIVIEPSSTNDDFAVDIVRTIGAHGWLRAPFDVGADVTNVEACVSFLDGNGPVNLYLRRGQFPTLTAFDKGEFGIGPPGDCMSLDLNDSPPLSIGRYFVGVYNDSALPVTVRLTVRLSRNLERSAPLVFTDPNTLPLLDDATTNASIFISTQALVAAVEVDVRLDHPRASDLVLYLVNPQGTRVMLAENRGREIAKGYGIASSNVVITNFGARVLDSSFEGIAAAVLTAGEYAAGWRIDSGDIDIAATYGDPVSHTGTNALDLNGYQAGAISTNVPTVPGRTYLLGFAFSKNSNEGSNPGFVPSMRVDLNGQPMTNVSYTPPVTYTMLNWSNGAVWFQATGITTRVAFVSTGTGFPAEGILLDTIRMDEVTVMTNGALYATFTEDAAKFPMSIKFAPPPFGDTNFVGTNVFISGFEGTNGSVFTNTLVFTNANRFTNGESFDGWLVRSNSVYVQTNSGLAYSDTNFLFLRTGAVARVLPTITGKEYVLQFATRTDRRLIYSTGVDDDDVTLPFGELDSHYFISSNYLTSASSNAAYVLFTNAMTANWFSNTNGHSRWIGLHPTLFVPGSGIGIPTQPAYRYRVDFDLSGYDLNSVSLLGQIAADDSIIQTTLNGNDIGFSRDYQAFLSFGTPLTINSGFRAGRNRLEFVIENRVLVNGTSAHGFLAEFAPDAIAGSLLPRRLPRVYTSLGRVKLWGSYTNDFVARSGGWQMRSVTFVATTNNTTLEFEGITPGVWLDHVQMRETGRKYYLPEEPMAPLLGHQSYGDWTLQVWDSRLGAAATNELLSWRLNLSYVRTNPPFTLIRPPQPPITEPPVTRPVNTNDFTYFAVDVPCDGATVTTIYSGATDPVEIWFNQDTFPTGTGTQPGDVLLFTGTGTTSVLDVGFYPLVRAGRYFIGVRNATPITTAANNITLAVTAVCPPPGPASIKHASFASGALTMSWSSDPGAEFKVLFASDPSGPWTAVPGSVTSTTGGFTFTDDGSSTGGLPDRRFYRLQRIK
ncbi:MAG TPA: proprotein convertase P-domain-containing protein [Candidatus Acidoferrum sp.]|nr:proprotein convertase P-domain-containing protein [Candidatus Acidoferrum sp.]